MLGYSEPSGDPVSRPDRRIPRSFTVHPTTGAKESKEMLQKEEGILYVGLDLENCKEGKQYQ